MPADVRAARSRVALGDIGALDIAATADAVAEDSVERRVHRAIGEPVSGGKLLEFIPGHYGLVDTARNCLCLHVVSSEVERQPHVRIVAWLPGAVPGYAL